MNYLFALSLNVKKFYLTHRYDPIRCYHSSQEWTWEQWQWRGNLHSPKLHHYWSLTIILFHVISRTLVGVEVLPHCSGKIGVIYRQAGWIDVPAWEFLSLIILLCFDLLTFWPGQKCHSRWCTGRKWHIPVAGNRKRLRRRWGVSILLRGSLKVI